MSRYEKYRSLREGIKELNAEKKTDNEVVVEATQSQQDDFLDFLGEMSESTVKTEPNEDTLEVAKTFKDIKNEKDPDVDRAIQSAKKSLGESESTRINILNKIKNPTVEKVVVDADEKYQTADFSAGMFIHPTKGKISEHEPEMAVAEVEEVKLDDEIETKKTGESKRAKTLMERLEEITKEQEQEMPAAKGEKSEVKAANVPEFGEDTMEIVAGDLDYDNEFVENGKGALILNVIIGILLVVFVALCVYIAIQLI